MIEAIDVLLAYPTAPPIYAFAPFAMFRLNTVLSIALVVFVLSIPTVEFIMVILTSSSSFSGFSNISDSATSPPKCMLEFVPIDDSVTSTRPENVQFNILLFVARPTIPPKPAIVPLFELNRLVSLPVFVLEFSFVTRTVRLLNNDPLSSADTPPNMSIVLPSMTELDTSETFISFILEPHSNVMLRNVASLVDLNSPASSAFIGFKNRLYKIGIESSSFCPINTPVNSISNMKLELFLAHHSVMSMSFTIMKLPSGSLTS